jgi:hypothetical protein
VFSVELTFKIDGRDVGLDKFAEALVARTVEAVKRDIQTLQAQQEMPVAVIPKVESERRAQPRAVSVEHAASFSV